MRNGKRAVAIAAFSVIITSLTGAVAADVPPAEVQAARVNLDPNG